MAGNLRIERDTFEKLFEATEAGDLTYDDFLEWLVDEIDELLEKNDMPQEVVLT